jgi:hypothetical protein
MENDLLVMVSIDDYTIVGIHCIRVSIRQEYYTVWSMFLTHPSLKLNTCIPWQLNLISELNKDCNCGFLPI